MIKQVERVADDSIFVQESCHSTWIFDTDKLRFRRILKGLSLDAHAATTAWRAYFGLEIDPISESFVVLLNPWPASERGLVDQVVDPADTRTVLASVLRQLSTKREDVVGRKHDAGPQ